MVEHEIPTETYVNMWYRRMVRESAKEYMRPAGKLVHEFANKYTAEGWGSPIRVGIIAGMPIVSSDVVNVSDSDLDLVTDVEDFLSGLKGYDSHKKTILVLPALTQTDTIAIHSLLRKLDTICQRKEHNDGDVYVIIFFVL